MTRPFLPLLVLLAACAAQPEAPPPLASAEEIAAAEAAPLDAWTESAGWNAPFAPFTVLDNIHYVGPAGVSSFLITTPEGHFLLDGGVPQSAPIIRDHIAALGYDIADVRYLLNSHAHFDHAGGLASLQRSSGAIMVASAADRPYLESGHIDFGPAEEIDSPPVRVDRVIADGETLTLGGVTLTAHITAGHTPGCTSWSMESEGRRVFFHCSATVAGQSLVPESWPGMIAAYRATFARVREIEADVFLANHGNFFDLAAKRDRQIAGDANAFVDPEALSRFNDDLERQFNEELARQQAAAN